MSPTTYELFAIKYAELDRPAPENLCFATSMTARCRSTSSSGWRRRPSGCS